MLVGGFILPFWKVCAVPMSALMHYQNAIMSFAVTYADQEWFAFAGDEHVLFFVDCDAVFCEDGDGAVVRCFAHAH